MLKNVCLVKCGYYLWAASITTCSTIGAACIQGAATNTSFMVNHYFAFDEKRVIDYDIKSFCFDNSILEEFHQIKLAKLKSVPAWHLTLDTID